MRPTPNVQKVTKLLQLHELEDCGQGMAGIFSRGENHPLLPYPFRQWPKLTTDPVRGTAYGFGYQLQDFRVAKIWALRSPVGWTW